MKTLEVTLRITYLKTFSKTHFFLTAKPCVEHVYLVARKFYNLQDIILFFVFEGSVRLITENTE